MTQRIEPGEATVLGVPMLLVAIAGLIANLAALLVLRGASKESIGMRGAYLEVLGDLLGSVAVVIRREGSSSRVATARHVSSSTIAGQSALPTTSNRIGWSSRVWWRRSARPR